MSKVLLSEEFSYLFEEVSNNNSFIEFLRNVVELLNDGNVNIKYTLSADSISFEEESYIKVMTGKDISDFDHDIITFQNFRILYFSGSSDPRYYNFDFSSKSKINDIINNFTTWIIWGNANNDRFIISVLIDIISKRIFRSLNNHNSNIPVYSIMFGSSNDKQLNDIANLTNAKAFDGKTNLIRAFKEVRSYN